MSDTNKPAVTPPAQQKKRTQEFVVLIRNPKTKTLHALLSPKLGQGALAVFEDSEQAAVQTQGIKDLQNKEFFIVPVE